MLPTALDRLLDARRDAYKLANAHPPPETVAPCVDGYLLASALQKAIRRNDLGTARRAGHEMLRRDPRRLWHRLAVVALEDVGLGDPNLAAEVVVVARSPQWRRQVGGDAHALDVVLTSACCAIKDRSADHALSVLRYDPPTPGRSKELARQSRRRRIDFVANCDNQLDERVFVASIIVGGDGSPDPLALVDLLRRLREIGVPETLIDACSLHEARNRDRLALVLPLLWLVWRKEGCRVGTETQALRHHDIGGIPDYAFDPLHTRVGRRAVGLWIGSFLRRPSYTATQVAMALWNGEAAVLANRLTWPAGERLRVRAHAADLTSTGLPPRRHDEIREWIDANILALQPARIAAWKEALKTTQPSRERGAE